MDHSGSFSDLQITAVYTQGKLLLAATGQGSGTRVLFEPESLVDRQPSFVLKQIPAGEGITAGTSFRVAMLFAVRSPPDEVIVQADGSSVRVPVLVAADAGALERREPVSLVRMAVSRSPGGRTRIPQPFEEMLGHGGEDVRTPLVWPLHLEPLFEGRLELAAADPRRAIGYSEGFDFTEAFLNALRALPPDPPGSDDRLTTVHVTETGALLGGRNGARLFVAILAY